VLSDAGIETPNGSGWVKKSDVVNKAIVHAVNPYMWHKNFATTNYEMKVKALPKTSRENPENLVGQPDPLFK
jgi:hypothetical protein